MNKNPLSTVLPLATLLVAGFGLSAHAGQGPFYDPANAASQSGFTQGYELYRTIGCPGRGLLDAPCQAPVAAPADSDKDGIPDADDQCPNTPAGDKVDNKGCSLPTTIVLKGVTFDNDSAALRADAMVVLDDAVTALKRYPGIKVEIAGHTDSLSEDAHNLQLSQNRAKAVMDYFVSKGIPAGNLSAKGYGEAQPIADNNTESGRAQNRRVELRVLD